MNHVGVLRLAKAKGESRSGEGDGFRDAVLEQYDREHEALRRYVLFLGVDCETAQEIVQESFLKLHQHLLAGGDRANLRAWLFRVSHNLTRNIQTSSRLTRTQYIPDFAEDSTVAAESLSAEDELLESERHRRYQAALRQLSKAQRQCLLLRTEGLKYREIAEMLDLSVSTVGENITRGLERLKELV